MSSSPNPPDVSNGTSLFVTTREIPFVDNVLAYADPHTPHVWLRGGEGFVAVGPAVIRQEFAASARAEVEAWWREVSLTAVVNDDVILPGTGLVSFGALTFDTASDERSVFFVPSAIVGSHGGRSWLTTISTSDSGVTPEPSVVGEPWSAGLGPGACTASMYINAVARAVESIRAGEAEKIVLARDLIGSIPATADVRRLASALSKNYPDCWTYAVDGLIGASPETLVTVHDGQLSSRVLAGTTPRGATAEDDARVSAALAASDKDRGEHEFAVKSVVETLSPFTRDLVASDEPFLLELPNVFHLATDVSATLDGSSSLAVVNAIHPTAAVAGTPTPDAIELIRTFEPFDRGRYAGPVGWIDAHGNGEWAIALRCAQIAPLSGSETRKVTAYAGAGIVAQSDPETELLETRVKFRPIVEALA